MFVKQIITELRMCKNLCPNLQYCRYCMSRYKTPVLAHSILAQIGHDSGILLEIDNRKYANVFISKTLSVCLTVHRPVCCICAIDLLLRLQLSH